MVEKTVYHFDENGNQTTEQKECHPRILSFTSRNIDPYWYKAILNVLNYQKRRDLQELHKLVDDGRVSRGLKLYRDKAIIKNTVTTHRGGDVHAVVQSEKSYTIIIKNYLPETLPQRMYEREEYIANLYVDCTCQDHIMSHYRDNSAMMCKHICVGRDQQRKKKQEEMDHEDDKIFQ